MKHFKVDVYMREGDTLWKSLPPSESTSLSVCHSLPVDISENSLAWILSPCFLKFSALMWLWFWGFSAICFSGQHSALHTIAMTQETMLHPECAMNDKKHDKSENVQTLKKNAQFIEHS